MISHDTIALIVTILVAVIGGMIYGNKRIDDLRSDMDARFGVVEKRFDDLIHHFDTRIDDLRGDLARIHAGINDLQKART